MVGCVVSGQAAHEHTHAVLGRHAILRCVYACVHTAATASNSKGRTVDDVLLNVGCHVH